jgi:hypothetical protein
LAATVSDPNASNFIANASRKKYFAMKIATVMIVEIIRKIWPNINRPLLRRWLEMPMALIQWGLQKRKKKIHNRKI